jgi:hypothetical protein
MAKMVTRNDMNTAFKVSLALNLMASHGILSAARFLDKHQIPIDVSLRVLGQAPGGTREAIKSVTLGSEQECTN